MFENILIYFVVIIAVARHRLTAVNKGNDAKIGAWDKM